MKPILAIIVALLIYSPSWAQQQVIRDPSTGRTSIVEPYRERDPYQPQQSRPAWDSEPRRVDIYSPTGVHRGTGRIESDGIIRNEQTGRREGFIR